jgi:hypothetical protein
MDDFKEKEKEITNEINKKIKLILPIVNLMSLALIVFLYLYLNIGVIALVVLFLGLIVLNYKISIHFLEGKNILITDYIYNELLPSIFNNHFKKYSIDKDKGISIAKAKKSDLLSVTEKSVFEEEDYITFTHNEEEYEMSDVMNIIHGSKKYSTSDIVDKGILLKQLTKKEAFKFVIRDSGKFDYEQEYFEKEKIDLYLTDNEEFDKKYSCYTNEPDKLKLYLIEDKIQKLLKYSKESRIEISHNETELFLFINDQELNFENVYTKEGNLDIEKVKENTENVLILVKKIIEEFKI